MANTDSAQYVFAIYGSPPGLLSLAPLRHDHNASLWRIEERKITLQRYWEFERISGEKHHSMPLHDPDALHAFIDSLLRSEGLTRADLSAIWGTPGLDTGRPLADSFADVDLPIHSLAHLFSAIAVDTEILRTQTILGMALDGAPDFVQERDNRRRWYACCVARAGNLEYCHVESPGALWLQSSKAYQREEGTLMALASATTCAVPADVSQTLGSLTFFGVDDTLTNRRVIVNAFDKLVRDTLAQPGDRAGYGYDRRFDHEDNVQSAAMKLVQEASMTIVERNIVRVVDEYGLDPAATYLALSGGFALNCPTTSAMMERFGFRGLLAPPCVNDSGQSLGLALLGLHTSRQLSDRHFQLGHAFHGSADLQLDRAVQRYGEFVEDVAELDEDRFVSDLEDGPVVWVSGAAEIGPRALGHRSLLGDPRRPGTKVRLNELKRRQWWRPVAPIVLEEHVSEWFADARRSPYMLEVFRVRAERADQVPAILHLDGTARLQTLAERDDALLHGLISAFARRTGVPILANTSLNDKGEPIVDDAAQAFNFCLRKGLSVLYVDGKRIRLRTNAPVTARPEGPEPRHQFFADQRDARSRLWAEWLALGHTAEALFVYARSPALRRTFEVAGSAEKLHRVVSGILRLDHYERTRVRQLVERYGPRQAAASAPADVAPGFGAPGGDGSLAEFPG